VSAIGSIGGNMGMMGMAGGFGSAGSTSGIGGQGTSINSPAATMPNTGPGSARNVMFNTQASALLNTFQAGLAGEDTLKMLLAMLVLDTFFGDKDDKENKSPSLTAMALLGNMAGTAAAGFLSAYSHISQIDSAAIASMNQQLAGAAGYTPAPNMVGGAINVMA